MLYCKIKILYFILNISLSVFLQVFKMSMPPMNQSSTEIADDDDRSFGVKIILTVSVFTIVIIAVIQNVIVCLALARCPRLRAQISSIFIINLCLINRHRMRRSRHAALLGVYLAWHVDIWILRVQWIMLPQLLFPHCVHEIFDEDVCRSLRLCDVPSSRHQPHYVI